MIFMSLLYSTVGLYLQVIKLYAWEPSFQQKISELRKKEVLKQRTLNILIACQEALYNIVPVVVCICVLCSLSLHAHVHTRIYVEDLYVTDISLYTT